MAELMHRPRTTRAGVNTGYLIAILTCGQMQLKHLLPPISNESCDVSHWGFSRRNRGVVGGWARGHVPTPLASEIQNIFGNFKTLYQLRMCVMTSYGLNVTFIGKILNCAPSIESLPTTPLSRRHCQCHFVKTKRLKDPRLKKDSKFALLF